MQTSTTTLASAAMSAAAQAARNRFQKGNNRNVDLASSHKAHDDGKWIGIDFFKICDW